MRCHSDINTYKDAYPHTQSQIRTRTHTYTYTITDTLAGTLANRERTRGGETHTHKKTLKEIAKTYTYTYIDTYTYMDTYLTCNRRDSRIQA